MAGLHRPTGLGNEQPGNRRPDSARRHRGGAGGRGRSTLAFDGSRLAYAVCRRAAPFTTSSSTSSPVRRPRR